MTRPPAPYDARALSGFDLQMVVLSLQNARQMLGIDTSAVSPDRRDSDSSAAAAVQPGAKSTFGYLKNHAAILAT